MKKIYLRCNLLEIQKIFISQRWRLKNIQIDSNKLAEDQFIACSNYFEKKIINLKLNSQKYDIGEDCSLLLSREYPAEKQQ